jgi:hypothetical protein
MSQSWHPEDADWREGSEGEFVVAASSTVLERLFAAPVVSPRTNGDVVPREPHLVLTCSAYDDDEDYEE